MPDKTHYMAQEEGRAFSWPNGALSVRHNMSNSGKILASCSSPDGPDMFYRDCSKWIMREKKLYFDKHS